MEYHEPLPHPKRSYEDDSPSSTSTSRSIRPFGSLFIDRSSYLVINPYSEDIHQYHCLNEKIQMLERNSPFRTEINQQYRAIVIDWLIEVSREYSLCLDTLFLAVNYFDRLLQTVYVKKELLQLLSITCLFIASKYEEVVPLTLDQLVNVEVYTKKNILDMERIVLHHLQFKLTVSTLRNFLSRYLHCSTDILPKLLMVHADFLSEMILSTGSLSIVYPPSQLAAAIVTVSRITFNLRLELPIDNYTLDDLRPIIRLICIIHAHIINIPVDKPLTAAREKYKSQEYGGVSILPLPHTLLQL